MGTKMPGMGYCWLTHFCDMEVRARQHVQIEPELLLATTPLRFYFWPPSHAGAAVARWGLSPPPSIHAKTCIFSPIECVVRGEGKNYIDGDLFYSNFFCGAHIMYVYGIGCA
jgi:hypothetical protein